MTKKSGNHRKASSTVERATAPSGGMTGNGGSRSEEPSAGNGTPEAAGVRGNGEVPIQVWVPAEVRKQVALMSVEQGESMRSVVLKGLRAIGIDVPEAELVDRRGRRPRT